MDKKLGEKWVDFFGGDVPEIPPISYLIKCARSAISDGNDKEAENYKKLIYLLHNSSISPYSEIDQSVKFGYGGIGVVIHKDCVIEHDVSIGQNVTLGGSPGKSVSYNGVTFHVPVVKRNSYIAAGAKVVGGLIIGEFSIVAANSVVNNSVDPFTLVGGQPARVIKKLNKSNCLKYRSFYSSLKGLTKEEFLDIFPEG